MLNLTAVSATELEKQSATGAARGGKCPIPGRTCQRESTDQPPTKIGIEIVSPLAFFCYRDRIDLKHN